MRRCQTSARFYSVSSWNCLLTEESNSWMPDCGFPGQVIEAFREARPPPTDFWRQTEFPAERAGGDVGDQNASAAAGIALCADASHVPS